jgi:ABC-type branched-subunit amino acid transport system substrate-binding protein
MNNRVPGHASARRFTVLYAVGAFLLLFFTISGCAPAPGPQVYKIGLVAPFEGAYRAVGYDAIYAARLAVREINAASVPEGWALELVAYDDRAEPDMARSSAHNLLTDPDVLVVIGHFTDATTTAASEIYITAKMPFLVIGEGPESPTCWHLAPSPQQQIKEILIATDGSTSSAAVWGTGSLADELAKQLTALGVHVVTTGPDHITTSLDTIFSTLPALQTAEYLAAWSEQGWQGRLFSTTSLHASDFARVSGEWHDRACFATPYPLPNDVLESEKWRQAYVNTGPHVPYPGPFALTTYEAIYTLSEVIAVLNQNDKVINRDELNVALADARHTGPFSSISWDVRGYWENAPIYLYCWHDTPQLVQRIQ